MQPDYDASLQSYFTDMDRPRDMFKQFVSAEKLPKRLIMFHGVGGVGKSSLLRMFRLDCKSGKIPVALASGDDAKSVLDVVTRWTEDLKGDGIKFATLNKTLESYRAIRAKVEDQVKKSQNKAADIASKAASKTAETAGGALLGAAIGSVIPGIGTAIGGALGGVVSGMGAEALTDWLRGFLSKPDIDLLLDPAKKLSVDFVEDLAKAAEKKRMVLLLDTYEQMSALEDWVGEMAQEFHPNVLVVITGRKLPDWQRVWHSWMLNAQVEELKPMTEDVMRELIRRYYATMRGGEPDPAQVDAIIKFARGLPMVVTSAVQLWVKYGVEDFQVVKAEIVANLVDRLMEGVPSALIPALEAAAVVRWFDQPILRAVMNKDDVREVYNELRRFPFVRTRVEGLALHDSVREMMDENLRVQDSERHAELHERAAAYFEKKLEKVTGEEAERLGLERLYHQIRKDENTGEVLFQGKAENLSLLRLSNQLRILVNDVQSYVHNNSKILTWLRFYTATLARREHLYDEAEQIYKDLSDNPNLDSRLRAYALCHLGEIYSLGDYLESPQGITRAIETIKRSLAFNIMDNRLIQDYFSLSRISINIGEIHDSKKYLEDALKFFEQSNDPYGRLSVHIEAKELYRHGLWKEYLNAHAAGLQILSNLPKSFIHMRGKILRKWARVWAFMGRYAEGEKYLRESMEIEEYVRDNITPAYSRRDIGWILGYQNKFAEAERFFQKSLGVIEALGKNFKGDKGRTLGLWGIVLIRQGNYKEAELKLLESLEIHKERAYYPGSIYEVQNWLGLLYELLGNWQFAHRYYHLYKDWDWQGQYYYLCCAKTGLIRVKHAQGDLDAIPPLLVEAEQLAHQYEYNDHLASLRLTQGHLTSPPTPLPQGEGSLTGLDYYKQAMTYALRYNRFLLDELLGGRPQGTPLRPIIPFCLERGEEGKKILSALRDWWQTGVNDIGTPRPDTISPIPEGIPLLEAEKLAREREPGDGSMQKSVVEQIKAVV